MKALIKDNRFDKYVVVMVGRLAYEKRQDARRKGVIKDIRLFENTIKKALTALISSGIDAEKDTYYNDDYIEYVIRVPKDKKTVIDESSAA